jgi:hypothetical protein
MVGLCSKYGWTLFKIWLDVVQNVVGRCSKYGWTLFKIWLDVVQNMIGRCSKYGWTLFKMWLDVIQNMVGLFRNMFARCSKYIWTLFKIHFTRKSVLRELVLPFGYKVWKILRFRLFTAVISNISISLDANVCDLVELSDILEWHATSSKHKPQAYFGAEHQSLFKDCILSHLDRRSTSHATSLRLLAITKCHLNWTNEISGVNMYKNCHRSLWQDDCCFKHSKKKSRIILCHNS